MEQDPDEILQRLQGAPRCGARTRRGTACEAPAVQGRKRCRMHGGAAGSGAPPGNKNALKHGRYTADEIELRKYVNALIRESRQTLGEL